MTAQFTNERNQLMDITKENLPDVFNTYLYKYTKVCQKLLATFPNQKIAKMLMVQYERLYFDVDEPEYTVALALHILKRYPTLKFGIAFHDGKEEVISFSSSNAQHFLDKIFTTNQFREYHRIMSADGISYDNMSIDYLVNAYFTRRLSFWKDVALKQQYNKEYLSTVVSITNNHSRVDIIKNFDDELHELAINIPLLVRGN